AQEALLRLDPYELRARGVDGSLSGAEFARALFHINQRRGFLSNRKTDKKDNDSGALKKAISELRGKIRAENCTTLGQWLHLRQQANQSVRARLRGSTVKDRAYDFYADRAMVEHEFDVIWAKQTALKQGLFSVEAGKQLKDILLFQRPLKPVVPGRCTLLPDQPRAPLALPSTQRFRIYQELNNLRILAPDLQEQALTLTQRDTLASLLERGTTTFKAMRKALKMGDTFIFNLEDAKRDRLRGNASSMVLSKPGLFGEIWHGFDAVLQDEIVQQLLEQDSEHALIQWLQARTGINEPSAEKIANVGLPDGYGSLSKVALDKILPHLMTDVITFDKAVTAAGFESHSLLSQTWQTGEIMPALPYYGRALQRHVAFEKPNPRNEEEQYGKIANPTVHIGLNQVRVVVNALIKEYGLPAQIVIEVARELKLNRERKMEIEREQAANQKRNDAWVREACNVLGTTAEHLDKNKRRELSQKMQLWYELNPGDPLNRCCPYSGERISIERLLTGDVEIEHILPYSKTLDDSMSNKTVAISRANRFKGNLAPDEAFGAATDWDYVGILQRVSTMYATKRNRFAVGAYQKWLRDDKDFLARALNDTAYLSRLAREYLSCICPEKQVHSIPGKMTALIRGKLGLNELLSGSTEKNRNDHRHHALDAMVIGITDRAMLKKFADANTDARGKRMTRLLDNVDYPWPTYRDHVQRALAHIYVSNKPEHGYQGAIHEETAWGLIGDGQVQRRVRNEANQREVLTKNLKAIPIRDASQSARHGLDENGAAKAYKGYVGGSNYCIEIWRDEKGKWNATIVSTFDAYQIIKALGEKNGWQRLRHPTLSQDGKQLVMRLSKKDTLRLEINGQLRTMAIATISTNGQIFMADHNEANVDARNRDKSNPYISKTAGSLKTAKARRCSVSPSGRLRDPGFRD
ncbi:MAG: hypothetical protein RL748_281, partial [Pseudomonadota bacterium]